MRGERCPESLVAQIYHRTSGVPLLVEEFTRMARESTVFESAGAPSPDSATADRENCLRRSRSS